MIKIPSKRGPQALRLLLDDFENNGLGLSFLDYYDKQGKIYFYDLLKELADTKNLQPEEFIDWGHDSEYVKAIGVGEFTGVVIDLVATLLFEAEEKIEHAQASFNEGRFADAIYHAYNIFIDTAKALLTSKEVKTNAKVHIIQNFQKEFVETEDFSLPSDFPSLVGQLNENEPSKAFASEYVEEAIAFCKKADAYYKAQHETETLKIH